MSKKNEKKRVYLDYAAATPLDPRVNAAMRPYMAEAFGNPSSIHEEGRRAHDAVEKARTTIADIVGVRPDEIIFTGSGTESAALALYGIGAAYPGAHMVASADEHAAVAENIRQLSQKGNAVTSVRPEKNGIINPRRIAGAIGAKTVLVSVIYVNNEIGAVQPLRDIARVIRKERTRRQSANETLPLLFHTDACQAAEYLDLAVSRIGVDMMSLNASKIYGPKGIGLLYKKRSVSLRPLWGGGGQEYGLRSGTEHVAAIAGFAKALSLSAHRKEKEVLRMKNLQLYFFGHIKKRVPQAVLHGPDLGGQRIANNIYISLPELSGESLVLFLDRHGVAVSAGSACDTQKNEESLRGGIRFTLGRHTTKKDIMYAVRALYDSIALLERARI